MIEGDLFKSLFDVIPFDVYVVDISSYEIIYMNKKMIQSRGDYIGQLCYERIYGEPKPCLFCKIPYLIDSKEAKPLDKTIVFELFNPVDDRWYQLQEKVITWPDGRTTKYSIAVDITELKETQNRLAEAHAQLALKNKMLEKLSITDSLTGLYNRLKIDEVLEITLYAAKRYGRTFSLLLIDIDHFKNVNDRFGHLVGDKVLKQMTEVFRSQIRKTDHLGRWGGEEFLIVAEDTDLQAAGQLAEKLRKAVESAFFPEVGTVTISLGVATWRDSDDRITIVQRADNALYKAKESGRNQIVVEG
ncbi:MAG: GGDEF domain-containing protein [Spirochaetes bacterium]|nr:GGDEF domain-containing protein [Spirochaetota bacterium]